MVRGLRTSISHRRTGEISTGSTGCGTENGEAETQEPKKLHQGGAGQRGNREHPGPSQGAADPPGLGRGDGWAGTLTGQSEQGSLPEWMLPTRLGAQEKAGVYIQK